MAKTDLPEDPRTTDPTLNDDSQPSVTSPEQVLAMAARNAGTPLVEAGIPAPADAVDLAYRTAIADVDAVEVGKAVAAKSVAGEEPDVESMGEGTEDTGTGAYEDRSGAQLKALAASKGLSTSGSKAELIERLRG